MEINEINNIFSNSTVSENVSTLSNSVNLKALENVTVSSLNSNSFTLDIETSFKRSDFANTIKESLNQLSVNQTNLQQLNAQENILSQIQNATTRIINSENISNTEEKYQPVIELAINQYNELRTKYTSQYDDLTEDTKSTAYFDGIVGFKPIKAEEILQAVQEQQQQIIQDKQVAEKNIEKIEIKELKTIGKEIEKVMAEAPFKPVDFGRATSDFSSANINSLVGSVATAQANAIPAHSQKLLA